jgi:hypothetical protein
MLPAHPFGALEQAMNLSIEQRETLNRWLPTILVALGIWLLARGIRRAFWAAFGLAWVMYWTGGRFPFGF